MTALLTAAALAAAVNIHIYAYNEKTVYVTVDAATLGAGVILEPTALKVRSSDTLSEIIMEAFEVSGIGYDGIFEDGVITYLSSVSANGTTVNIPEKLINVLGKEYTGDVLEEGYYSEFDYADSGGWMYSVNNVSPSVGISDYVPDDQDVIRLRFTLVNYGGDIGLGMPEYTQYVDGVEFADATELIRIAAVTKNAAAYSDALTVIGKYGATQIETDEVYSALLEGMSTSAPTVTPTETPTPAPTEIPAHMDAFNAALAAMRNGEPKFGNEWEIIVMSRGGYDPIENYDYYDGYYRRVLETLEASLNREKPRLGNGRATEYERLVIALTAIGRDASDVGGYDLFSYISDYDYVTDQGVNGMIYALIAADTAGYEFSANGTVTREKLLSGIIDAQLDSGGWGLETIADVDVTAMALQALARYADDKTVGSAIGDALGYLSSQQLSGGGFASYGTENAESPAQVLIALCALGVDPDTDSRFIKNGITIPDALGQYRVNDGFAHTIGGKKNTLATRQVTCALASYYRFKDEKTSLYDMSDVRIRPYIEATDNGLMIYSPVFQSAVLIWREDQGASITNIDLNAGKNYVTAAEAWSEIYLWNSLSALKPLCDKYQQGIINEKDK